MEEKINKRPNVYKCMMGMMDMTYKEMSSFLGQTELFVGDVSEICRAVRGFTGPKYDNIRTAIIKAFTIWLGETEKQGVPIEVRTFANQLRSFATI